MTAASGAAAASLAGLLPDASGHFGQFGGRFVPEALVAALKSGHVRGAGLDVFASEPLPADHPFWTLPQVILSPHYAGETINQSARPAERFARNLTAWRRGVPLEGLVDLAAGY